MVTSNAVIAESRKYAKSLSARKCFNCHLLSSSSSIKVHGSRIENRNNKTMHRNRGIFDLDVDTASASNYLFSTKRC